MRALKIAGVVMAGVVVAIVLVIVIGIPARVMNGAIGDRVERATGYRMTLSGTTRIGLWRGFTVTLHGVALQGPDHDAGATQLTIDSVTATVPLARVLSPERRLSLLTISRPVLRVPLQRERGKAAPASTAIATDTMRWSVDRVDVIDGTVVLSDPAARFEQRIDGVAIDTRMGADRRIDISGRARLANQPLTFTASAVATATGQQRQPTPISLALDAPGLLSRRLTATAEVRLNGAMLTINALSGSLGAEAFNGWASADLAGKPFVKLDLDFQRLTADMPGLQPSGRDGEGRAWSEDALNLSGLNYADAQVRLTAADLAIGAARFAPASIDATLASGALKLQARHLGVYGGDAEGECVLDASGPAPALSIRADLQNVRALPMLTALADFDRLDGRMQAKIAVRAGGQNLRAMVASAGGTGFAIIQNGEIVGLNVAKMVRSLTSGTLSGWQDGKAETTDLTQLSASFRIDNGRAATNDLALAGPLIRMTGAGTLDLADATMAFRVEPKLVLTIEGQGSAAAPVGLGVPVVIKGPWAAPLIYPEISGMLDNPDAAYAQLRQLGQGLFGRDFLEKLPPATNPLPGGAAGQGGGFGEAIGNLIQQGLGAAQTRTAPPSGSAPSGAVTPAVPPASDQDGASPMNDIMRRLFGR